MLTANKYDLKAPGLFLEPHPTLRRMRAEDPVYFSPQLGAWVLTRYDDVCAELRDPRLSVVEETKRIEELPEDEQAAFELLREIFVGWGGRSEVDDHAGFIKLMKRNFTPAKVLAQAPRIEKIMNDLVDAALERGELDVANDIAHPLAMTVVCGLSGIPADEMDMLLRNSNYISGLLEMGEPDQLLRCQQGMLELTDYLRPIVADHRENPRNTLIGILLGPEAADLDYTEDEVIAQAIMFLVVGYHTTANLLCNGLQMLFDHPEQREKLVAGNFELLANAFDEMMRVQGPVASVRRLALRDFTLRDQVIHVGDTVMLALGAANRDPEMFADPDRFDVARPNAKKQIGFTVGRYSCMGQALARLEGQIFFRTLLSRFPNLRPKDAAADWVAFRPLGRELHTLRVAVD
ncbi:cytochrome P450 [Streptomyces wedmorensis]